MKPLLVLGVLTVLVGLAVWVPTLSGGPRETAQPSAVQQRVTLDHGSRPVGDATIEETGSDDTVLSLLQDAFAVETGEDGAVESIEGHAAGRRDGRPVDWAYYVNGIRSSAPAAETPVNAGDRIWWDLNGDVGAIEPAAVVGSFPEPFQSGLEGRRRPVRIECTAGAADLCDEVSARLDEAGVPAVAQGARNGPAGPELLRIVVGPWSEVRRDPTVRQFERGPGESGVFAQVREEGRRLALYDERGRVVRTLGAGTGLVAAARFEGQLPVWVVTGTDEVGAAAAATALREEVLRGRFAVAIDEGRPVALPLQADGEGD